MSIKLPAVYQTSYALCLDLMNRTRQFPKHYRPTLGRKIEESAISLSMDVRSMLLTQKKFTDLKQTHLLRTVKTVDDLKFLLQISFDLKIFSPGAYGELNESLGSVGRQIGALVKHSVHKA